MLGIGLRFFSGRYFANPWGHHINEGAVEWPPSPWRLMRAIVATWLRTTDHPEDQVRRILSAFSPPYLYASPPISFSQKAHYMYERVGGRKDVKGTWTGTPLTTRDGPYKKGSTKLLYDPFVVIGPSNELCVLMPDTELSEEDAAVLNDILARMNYLGRSESWVHARVMDISEAEDAMVRVNVRPVGPEESNHEIMVMESLAPSFSLMKEKKGVFLHPLMSRTGELRRKGLDTPPGTKMVPYLLGDGVLSTTYAGPTHMGDEDHPSFARYLIDANPPIRDSEALPLAEIARNASMKIHSVPSSPLSGKGSNGEINTGHDHAYFLPYDEDGDGYLDHLLVHFPLGADAAHRGTLERLRKIYGYPFDQDVRLILLEMGNEQAPFLNWPLARARRWRSATPYLLSRHPKLRGNGSWKLERMDGVSVEPPTGRGQYPSIEHAMVEYGVLPGSDDIQRDGPMSQLLRSIEHMGLPRPMSVRPVPHPNNHMTWLDHKVKRNRKIRPASHTPYGFEITFHEEVSGPVCLGYACHLGLGLFLPVFDEDE